MLQLRYFIFIYTILERHNELLCSYEFLLLTGADLQAVPSGV